MVRQLLVLDVCDGCARERYATPNVPATVQHTLSVDGGPVRELLLCARCERDFQDAVIELYEAGIDPVDQKADKAPKETGKKRRPKELEKQPPAEPEREAPAEPEKGAAKRREHKTRRPSKPKSETQLIREATVVICTEAHKETGQPQEISYAHRQSHTNQCHPGKKLWDIVWKDPAGALKFPCTAHRECMATGLTYISEQAVKMHIYSQPQLKRIDQEQEVQ